MSINSYVWKDRRMSRDRQEKQVEIRMIDMTEEQLQYVYNHCKQMLYNENSKNRGRMIVLNRIAEQLDYCRAELAYRYFLSLRNEKTGEPLYSADSLMTELRNITGQVDDNFYLGDVMSVPSEYSKVKLKDLKEACKDALGLFDHSKITQSFLCDMGVYLSQRELKEIDTDLESYGLNPNKFTLLQKIENHIKIPLNLKENQVLRINPKGLNATEFSAMINMKGYKGPNACKYSDLSTNQLKALLSKVLYALEAKVQYHIKTWSKLMSQIEEVAEYKQIKLD